MTNDQIEKIRAWLDEIRCDGPQTHNSVYVATERGQLNKLIAVVRLGLNIAEKDWTDISDSHADSLNALEDALTALVEQ